MFEPKKAIDLYSGVGGWSLGLRLAGINVSASYERSKAANETNQRNNGHEALTVDIRKMDLKCLPDEIDLVVGSPPCTQFSFSNRGGNGDLVDGLEDVIRFLDIIDRLKPPVWAMENVPRLAKILDKELKDTGCLARFKHLGIKYSVFNMEEFGLPQRRKRCIVGNFDFELLKSYTKNTDRLTLGAIVDALNCSKIIDPIFGEEISSAELYDHELEEPLDSEEIRINRASKLLHPIYNGMPFPDPLDRTVRTITATCTRVSRESIVIETTQGAGEYRRLSIRERALAQGFPVSFQFYGASHGQKLQMVGNAIPPLFAYYVGHALLGTAAECVPAPASLADKLQKAPSPPKTEPHKRGTRYRPDRSFKFSISSLRLKSGVRFELNNGARSGVIEWQVVLVFGSSKAIRQLVPQLSMESSILKLLRGSLANPILEVIGRYKSALDRVDVAHLQAVWSHTGPGATRPFMLLDLLDEFAAQVISLLERDLDESRRVLDAVLHQSLGIYNSFGTAKLLQNAQIILAGLMVGSCANATFANKAKPIGTSPATVRRRIAN